jgi:hypothetical protein
MANYETHKFFCLACGSEGIPLSRKRARQREQFHRKKLYCYHCQNTVNHIECKTSEDVKIFKENFKQGVYKDEAQESLAVSRNTWLW